MKQEKIISGNDILQTDEKRTWRCTFKTAEGEIITVPLTGEVNTTDKTEVGEYVRFQVAEVPVV